MIKYNKYQDMCINDLKLWLVELLSEPHQQLFEHKDRVLTIYLVLDYLQLESQLEQLHLASFQSIIFCLKDQVLQLLRNPNSQNKRFNIEILTTYL